MLFLIHTTLHGWHTLYTCNHPGTQPMSNKGVGLLTKSRVLSNHLPVSSLAMTSSSSSWQSCCPCPLLSKAGGKWRAGRFPMIDTGLLHRGRKSSSGSEHVNRPTWHVPRAFLSLFGCTKNKCPGPGFPHLPPAVHQGFTWGCCEPRLENKQPAGSGVPWVATTAAESSVWREPSLTRQWAAAQKVWVCAGQGSRPGPAPRMRVCNSDWTIQNNNNTIWLTYIYIAIILLG